MIRCPKCSTLNRDSSRFCNECGAPLQKTRLRCPMCGTLNPVGNIFCDQCHARLLPAEGIVPPEPEAKLTEETLPRVQGISLPSRAASASDRAVSGADADVPDWLMGLLEPGNDAVDDGVAEGAITSDWLSAADAPRSIQDEAPAPRELPDWLTELAAEPEIAAGVEAAAEPAVPDWMLELAVEAPVSAAPEPAAELPDWLAGMAMAEPQGARPVSPEPETFEALPDWLSDLGAATPESAVEAPAALEPLEELPDWLSGVVAAEPEIETAAAPEPAVELPDWLSGLVEAAPEVKAAPTSAPEPVEALPDWLSGLMEEPSEPTHAPAAMAAPPAAAALPEAEFPDWLSGMMEDDLSAAPDLAVEMPAASEAKLADALEREELPDWLSGMMEEEASEAAPETPAEAQGARPVAAELPDWLSAWDQDAGPVAAPLSQAAPLPLGALDEDYDDDTWPERKAVSPEMGLGAAAELEPAALPDWLQALGPRPDTAAEALPEGLEQAEVPVWLEQLRPPGTSPLDPSRAPETLPGDDGETGGLVRAEIPDWVQQYRPSATGPTGVSSPLDLVVASPPESEGPLSGIAGLLPALPIVDAPTTPAPAAAFALPQSVVQEAQLWQQLLERAPSSIPAKPKAARRAVWPAVLVRIILAVVLALASVLSFSETPLAQPPEQPGVLPLYTAIDALAPGAEVLIAFEYGPAEVDEMSFIVEALLEHLLSREVRIVALSTLPEGPGLIEERFAWALSRPDTVAENLVNRGFVAGGAAGVSGTLANLDPETGPQLLLVVASRPEKLKVWVEQNAVANSARRLSAASALPLVVGASAATGPQIRPYLEATDITGWLSGFPGVAAYWQARGFPPREDISRRLDALLLTQWAAASFLLAGALFYLLAGKQRTV